MAPKQKNNINDRLTKEPFLFPFHTKLALSKS